MIARMRIDYFHMSRCECDDGDKVLLLTNQITRQTANPKLRLLKEIVKLWSWTVMHSHETLFDYLIRIFVRPDVDVIAFSETRLMIINKSLIELTMKRRRDHVMRESQEYTNWRRLNVKERKKKIILLSMSIDKTGIDCWGFEERCYLDKVTLIVYRYLFLEQ